MDLPAKIGLKRDGLLTRIEVALSATV